MTDMEEIGFLCVTEDRVGAGIPRQVGGMGSDEEWETEGGRPLITGSSGVPTL